MPRIGFVLSQEQFPVTDLLEFGVAAERAGFDTLWTSDHFHPWMANQGHAGQAWITLSGPYGARLGTITSTTVTITDDDNPPTVAWQGANTNAGEAVGSALVPVVLSAPSAFTVTVNYATSNGTATAGSDYTSASGTLTRAPAL